MTTHSTLDFNSAPLTESIFKIQDYKTYLLLSSFAVLAVIAWTILGFILSRQQKKEIRGQFAPVFVHEKPVDEKRKGF